MWYKYFNNSEAVMNWLIDIMEEAGYTTGIEPFIPTIDNESGAIYYVPGAHGWYDDEHPTTTSPASWCAATPPTAPRGA